MTSRYLHQYATSYKPYHNHCKTNSNPSDVAQIIHEYMLQFLITTLKIKQSDAVKSGKYYIMNQLYRKHIYETFIKKEIPLVYWM